MWLCWIGLWIGLLRGVFYRVFGCCFVCRWWLFDCWKFVLVLYCVRSWRLIDWLFWLGGVVLGCVLDLWSFCFVYYWCMFWDCYLFFGCCVGVWIWVWSLFFLYWSLDVDCYYCWCCCWVFCFECFEFVGLFS